MFAPIDADVKAEEEAAMTTTISIDVAIPSSEGTDM